MTASGQIPAFGKGVLPPNMQEAEGFLDEVDDVSRLIEGLHSGKINADYVDKRIREKEEEKKQVIVKEKKKVKDAEKKKYENLPDEKKEEIKIKVRERVGESDAGQQWDEKLGVTQTPTPNTARASRPGPALSALTSPRTARPPPPLFTPASNPPKKSFARRDPTVNPFRSTHVSFRA